MQEPIRTGWPYIWPIFSTTDLSRRKGHPKWWWFSKGPIPPKMAEKIRVMIYFINCPDYYMVLEIFIDIFGTHGTISTEARVRQFVRQQQGVELDLRGETGKPGGNCGFFTVILNHNMKFSAYKWNPKSEKVHQTWWFIQSHLFCFNKTLFEYRCC